ncbi:DEKNAAC101236 [Brettanomyces naardenensis]|uniref:DEKNAAC101236 n=1 Tax=Brettanomyces naardenensis TaxID=13370 RepID=A0A448YHL9_BRENA|nr:DEKNAAC101236 [Brettanomyces naardenensis]
MTLRSPEEIFYTVEDNITGTENKRSFSRDKLKEQLTDKTTCDTTILVLDEMDSVINKYQQTLFELFSWASNLPSVSLGNYQPGLILVGIANALDLTDRFLPRLRSNRINPKLVQFLPYTADQIGEVITAKLYSLNPKDNRKLPPPIVHPVAIKLCSKKAAVNTGDLRKAFDIIHRAIEVVEQMTMKRLSGEQFERLTLETAPKVMIAQIARVCNSAFDTNYQLKLEALNFQAKAVLCCLFKFEEKKNSSITDPSFKKGHGRKKCTKLIPSINSFFEFYSRYLKSVDRMLSTLKRSEFLEVLNTLESNSLINLSLLADNLNKFTSGMVNSNGNGNSNKRVISFGNYQISTNVPKSELLKAIGKIEILGKVMMGSRLN